MRCYVLSLFFFGAALSSPTMPFPYDLVLPVEAVWFLTKIPFLSSIVSSQQSDAPTLKEAITNDKYVFFLAGKTLDLLSHSLNLATR